MAKILLVDDNAELLKMLFQLINREGHEVTTAGDGNQALKLAHQNNFDLVITDLIMPEKEGVETILEFRKLHPRTRIIAMSGGGSRVSARGYLGIAHSIGVVSTLVKPFSTAELMDTMAKELGALQ